MGKRREGGGERDREGVGKGREGGGEGDMEGVGKGREGGGEGDMEGVGKGREGGGEGDREGGGSDTYVSDKVDVALQDQTVLTPHHTRISSMEELHCSRSIRLMATWSFFSLQKAFWTTQVAP